MMRLAALWLLAASQGAGSLVIRAGDLATPLPILQTQRGPMVRLDDALQPLGAALVRSGADRFRLIAGGTEFELTLGAAVAKAGPVTETLAAPPTLFEGRLLVPLSLLTDVLPRRAQGFAWKGGELRREAALAERREAAAPAPPPSAPSRVRDSAPAVPRAPREPVRRLVVVDAGHGGPDRGMTGPIGATRKVAEKDITLGISRALRDALARRGVEVLMTRTTDTLIALADRGRIANRAKASLFVSIHVNAANPRWREPGSARGFETYFLSEAKTDDERRVEAMENEAVKYEGEEEVEAGDPLAFILNDMKQNEYLRESSDLAATIQGALRVVHPAPDRGVKQAGFLVLVRAFMPAVLVEVGFGTNRSDAAYITSDAGQAQLAGAVADAVVGYLDRLDRRIQGGSR